MRHARKRDSLGRAKDQTDALLKSLARELFFIGGIKTTLTKAKVLRPFVEKIISKGKKAMKETDPAKQLHYKRLIIRDLSPDILSHVLEKAGSLLNRDGGFTRILKLAGTRRGDNTQMAFIQILAD